MKNYIMEICAVHSDGKILTKKYIDHSLLILVAGSWKIKDIHILPEIQYHTGTYLQYLAWWPGCGGIQFP